MAILHGVEFVRCDRSQQSHLNLKKGHVRIGHLFRVVFPGRDSLFVRVPDSWSRGCQFESTQEWREICFFSRVNPTLFLPQWHVKVPGHSAKSEGGRLHLNTHRALTQRSRSGLTMPLSRHSVGTYQETSSHATRQGTLIQSSQLAEPLWTDPGLKSGISVRKLVSS